jgi:DNA-binding transcriptional ArsR family regulator
MNETARILCAIPEKASISITALLSRLGVDPNELDSHIFTTLNTLEETGLITVIRPGNGRVASVQLTCLGAERAQEAMEGAAK